jgi:hypothetical protein
MGSSSTSRRGSLTSARAIEHPLLLAARELADRTPPELGERHGFERVVHGQTVLVPGEAPPSAARRAAGAHDLLDGGRDVEREDASLGHVPDAPRFRDVGRRGPEAGDRAGVGPQDPEQQAGAASTCPIRWARPVRETPGVDARPTWSTAGASP